MTRADRARMHDVMARAFDDDPLANWAALQDGRRFERVKAFIAIALDSFALRHDECYTTSEFAGGAYWIPPPGKFKPGFFEQLRMGPGLAKVTGWRRAMSIGKALNEIEKKHPPTPHFYLMGLGVVPEMQGRSIGTQLMQPVLERCDREGIPAYLESSKEKNVPLYERNGFRVTEVFTVPDGGPPLWLMWRDPQ